MATIALGTAAPLPLTVLLIDSDAAFVRALAKHLRGLYRVLVAADDTSAIQALATNRIDVVVSDATVGHRGATDLHAAVSRLAPGLEDRMIFMTCGGFDESLQAFFDRVENPVLYKGADFSPLRAAIESVMPMRSRAQAA